MEYFSAGTGGCGILRGMGRVRVAFACCLCAAVAAAPGCRRGTAPTEGTPLPPVRVDERIDLLSRLDDADLGPATGRIERKLLPLRDDERDTVLVHPPGRVRFRDLPLLPGAILSFGYAVTAPPAGTSPPLTLRVEAIVGGTAREIFAAAVEVLAPGHNEWREAEVPLPAAGAPAARFELEFRVEAASASGAAVALSWPTIRSEGAAGPDDRAVVAAESRRRDLLDRLDDAVLLAAPDGRRPLRAIIDLPGGPTVRPAVVTPPGTGLRYRLELSGPDALRLRFHAGPAAGAATGPLAGTVRVRVRVRDATGSDSATAWDDAGDLAVDVTGGGRSYREARAVFPLGRSRSGPAELELRVDDELRGAPAVAGFSELEVVTRSSVRRRAAAAGGRNVVVLLVDALRADRLGAYGYARDTSPNLDRAAAAGVVFDRAFTTATWTLPAVVSLLTGTLPSTHGVVRGNSVLSIERRTLGDVLREAGYSTAAFVGNPLVDEARGFRAGFEDFTECFFMNAGRIHERLLPWIRAHRAERFFLYVHYIDPHAAYAAPGPFYSYFDPQYAGRIDHNTWDVLGDPATAAGLPVELRGDLGEQVLRDPNARRILAGTAFVDRLRDLYDGEVRYWDAQFAELRSALAAEGLDDETILVVLSDHGEEFAEHRHLGHGYDLFDETLRIPLVVLDPDETRPRRVAACTSIADVATMLLERLGLPALEPADGWPLGRIEGPEGATRTVSAHTAFDVPTSPPQRPEETPALCLRGPDLKVIYVPRDEAWSGWRPESDPGELQPLAADDPAVRALQPRLREQRALYDALPVAARPAGSNDAILRALGYVW
jgi:arylsulfatase A-like enzyme